MTGFRSDMNYPSEVEMARAYLAQLDPSTVSADEYALAVIEARYPTPPKGFSLEVDDE